ncbi:adenylate/guanylate cyclase domain-containing protein [Acidobacteriota bacterium]
MPKIHVAPVDGQTYDYSILKKKITIGRSQDNDIVLPDSSVSRHHAKISKKKDGYFLTDLGSFNGTEVAGKLTKSARLKHDDRIVIGLNTLVFFSLKKQTPAPTESLVLEANTDYEKWDQEVVKSRPEDGNDIDSKQVLDATISGKGLKSRDISKGLQEADQELSIDKELSTLERSNKVLFVLYEISKQLNSIHDFNDLLKKMMDLIFIVIDADYGFLILIEGEEQLELTPIVIKYREHKDGDRRELKASRTIMTKVIRDKVALLTSNAMDDSRLNHSESLFIQGIRSAMCVPLWRKDKIIGVIQLDTTRMDNRFTKDDLELLNAIGCQMAMIIEQANLNKQIREEELMISRLERFHSPQVIELILKEGLETKSHIMEPKDLTVTILFSDIAGFTRLSEQMPPREINMILNQYFSRMTDIIFEHDGTLDKYIGDGLMAVFGAPMEKKDDAKRALLAALKLRQESSKVMHEIGLKEKINIRIGINTGRVVAGNIGSPKRMDYTVIGDPVNIASRLESIAKSNQILIGKETYNLVKGDFNIKKIGLRKVKGKSAEIMVYEVFD